MTTNKPELCRSQPCGCVVCICEHETKCMGCGAKHCGTHPVGQFHKPVYQQPAPDVAMLQRKLEASFQREEQLEREVRELKREKFKKFRGEECWIWAGDGSDRLETLTCPVVIAPADLMTIINRGSPSPGVAGLVEALELMVTTHDEGGWPTATIAIARDALTTYRKGGDI